MHPRKRLPVRAALAALGVAVVAGACTDRATDAVGPGGGTPGGGPPGKPVTIQAVQCRADVGARQVTCDDPGAPAGASADILVGGQNRYVRLQTADVDYSGGVFSFTVTIRNLIPQPMGTTNPVTLAQDPNGVRIFFHQLPAATAGSGSVTVANADGTATFTAADQPYFQYNTVLEQYEQSAPKTWEIAMPPSVAAFDFVLYVSAPVPYPDGYVEIVGTANARAGAERKLRAWSRSAVGNVDSAAVFTFAESDPLLAVANDTGLVRAYRAGTVTITATDNARPERGAVPFSFTVRPIRRTWTGAAGNTDWSLGANWLPDSIAPVAADTAVIPDDRPVYPALVANVAIAGVEVEDANAGGTIPTISLGAFNLTASGDVYTTNSGTLTSSSGRLILTGTARTVRGTVPPLTVSGTYSLTGNLIISRQLRVDAGRLTDGAFRIQVNNN